MSKLEGIPTVAEVARVFGVHTATLYRWASEPFRPADAPRIVILGGHVFFQDQFGADMFDSKVNPGALAERQSQADEQRAGELRKELVRDDWVDPATGATRTAQERDAVRDARVKAQRQADHQAELDAERARVQATGGDPRRKTLGPPQVRVLNPNKPASATTALQGAQALGVRVVRDEPVDSAVGAGVL